MIKAGGWHHVSRVTKLCGRACAEQSVRGAPCRAVRGCLLGWRSWSPGSPAVERAQPALVLPSFLPALCPSNKIVERIDLVTAVINDFTLYCGANLSVCETMAANEDRSWESTGWLQAAVLHEGWLQWSASAWPVRQHRVFSVPCLAALWRKAHPGSRRSLLCHSSCKGWQTCCSLLDGKLVRKFLKEIVHMQTCLLLGSHKFSRWHCLDHRSSPVWYRIMHGVIT